MSPNRIGRREFIAKSATGLAGLALGTAAIGLPSRVLGANDRLSIGLIGCGGQGRGDMNQAMRFSEELNLEVTAVCDVWRLHREAAVNLVEKQYGRKPREFVDYREMLALDDLDAVIIATPDFQHCRQLIDAMKAGKDVFVEKPMAMYIDQANESLKIARETKRVVQVGTQRRSDARHVAGARFVRSGALGTVSRVEAAWNDCGPRWRKNISNVKQEDVDWRRFLLGKKMRSWDPSRFREWHLYSDYSTGGIGLLGSHMIDVVHWFMEDSLPVSAVSLGGNFAWNDKRENLDTVYTLLEYPKGFIVRYCHSLGNAVGSNCYFYGTNGTFDTATWKVTGAGGAGADKITEEKVITAAGAGHNHVKNFLECVRSRLNPNATIEDGYAHSVVAIMSAESLRTGRKVLYDKNTQEITLA